MSVVKKYAPGGSVTTTDYSELEKYLKNKINKELTNKSIIFAEEILPTFIENLKSGNIKELEYTPKTNWSGRISLESPDEAEMQLNYWFKNKDIVKGQEGLEIPEKEEATFTFSKPNINLPKDFLQKWQQALEAKAESTIVSKPNVKIVNTILTPEQIEAFNKVKQEKNKPVETTTPTTVTQSTIPQEKIAAINKEKEEAKQLFSKGKLALLKLKQPPSTFYNTKDQLPIKIDETKVSENKEKFNLNSKDLADIINVGLYANALSNINKNYRLTNKALSEQMIRQSLLKQPNIRVVTPNINAADEQIAKANTTANRVANSIADIDKALGYRAQVAKNVGEIEAKTKLGAAQQTEQQLAKVQDIKMKIDQANTQIENTNKGRIADIMSKFHQNAINANLSKQSELNKFVNTLSQNLKVRERDKSLKDLIDFQSNPEYVALNEDYNKLQEEAIDFNDRLTKDPTLINSQEKRNLELKEKLLNNKMRDMLSKRSSLQTKVQYGMYAKGGSLEDKVTLENVKQHNRKELEELKQYYKQLLKNDDLLLKSLIKIFK